MTPGRDRMSRRGAAGAAAAVALLGAALFLVLLWMVFFWVPMQPHPRDVDVKALLRTSVLYNVPTACNRATAGYMISSSLLEPDYVPVRKDYSVHMERELPE